jgi:transposase-like protein
METLVSRKPHWQTKFGRFIHAFGVEELARRMDVSPSAIYHWVRGSTSPKRTNATKLRELAEERGSSLTLNQIDQHVRELRSERYTTSSLKPQPARV